MMSLTTLPATQGKVNWHLWLIQARQSQDSSLNSVLDGMLSHAQADLPWIISYGLVSFIHFLYTISKFLERNTRFKMKAVSNIRDGFIGPN